MGIEIERKFLVCDDSWRHQAVGVPYAQGYLTTEPGRTVRVRIAGTQGFLTIKGATDGCSRTEFEYAIPVADVQAMFALCSTPPVEKLRYKIAVADLVWEVDEFQGANQGLILAEVELEHPDQSIQMPGWAGAEVTHDRRYYNSYLAQYPYSTWVAP